MKRHLDVARSRYLPAVSGEAFVLASGEPLGPGLQRISLEQFDQAIDSLTRPQADPDTAIHAVRKALKRLRAILRMVRPEIGDRVYRYENRSLRDAARLVSPVRDSAVMVATVTALADRFAGALPVDVFDDVAERLDRRAGRIRHRIIEEGDALHEVVDTLARSRTRFAGWPVDESEREAYGSSIRNHFDAVGRGVADVYGRGRREMKQALAQPSAPHFHQWRKRVKYLRHQLEILQPLWPEVVGATAMSLDRLGDVLGEEHDLAELLGLLGMHGQVCPDAVERSLLAALAQHRRAELHAAARVLGTRLYTEKPGRFTSRLETYWDATQIPIGIGLRPFA